MVLSNNLTKVWMLVFFKSPITLLIKFLPLDILGVSQRILWKNEYAVYRLQISALVPEIFLKNA